MRATKGIRARSPRRGLNAARFAATTVLFGLAWSSPAGAWDRYAAWSATYDPQFPIIRVNLCPDQINSYFSSVGFSNYELYVQEGLNEWFVRGGVDMRMREYGYSHDLSHCAHQGLPPADGAITVSAAFADGALGASDDGICFSTINTTTNQLESATVFLFEGNYDTNGIWHAYPWMGSTYDPSAHDTEGVLLHELGHALGLNHTADNPANPSDPDAVMKPGGSVPRMLRPDDHMALVGVKAGVPYYNNTLLNMWNAWTGDRSHWNLNQNGPSTNYSVGSPVACAFNSPSFDEGFPFYNGAYANVGGGVTTFSWSASGYTSGVALTSAATVVPPSIMCSDDGSREMVFWEDTASKLIEYKHADTSTFTWSTTQTLTSGGFGGTAISSVMAPAIHEVHGPGGIFLGYVIAYVDSTSGLVTTMVSMDGETWTNAQQWGNIRTFQPLQWACLPTTNICTLTWVDGNYASTPQSWESFWFNYRPGPPRVVTGLAVQGAQDWLPGQTNLSNSYGGGVDYDFSSQVFFDWQDRNTGYLGYTSTLHGAPGFASNVGLQGPPDMVWSRYYNTFSVWYAYAGRYGAL